MMVNDDHGSVLTFPGKKPGLTILHACVPDGPAARSEVFMLCLEELHMIMLHDDLCDSP